MTVLDENSIEKIFNEIRSCVEKFERPMVDEMVATTSASPFKVLIATMLSARTLDKTTLPATDRLFTLAKSEKPEDMLKLSVEAIEKAIYPVGFYHNKAKHVLEIAKDIITKYDNKVPDKIEELVKLKGVGRKTANLVLTRGFNKLAICVDTHMHRFFNRIGYLETKKPLETEMALRKKLPKKFWIESNGLIVTFGQNICTPISPKCSMCPISELCPKIGVKKKR